MNISVKPEIQKFIDERVKAGDYGSTDELFEAAVARLMLDPAPELDEETLAALDEGEAQLDRGEGIPLDEAFTMLRHGARRRPRRF